MKPNNPGHSLNTDRDRCTCGRADGLAAHLTETTGHEHKPITDVHPGEWAHFLDGVAQIRYVGDPSPANDMWLLVVYRTYSGEDSVTSIPEDGVVRIATRHERDETGRKATAREVGRALAEAGRFIDEHAPDIYPAHHIVLYGMSATHAARLAEIDGVTLIEAPPNNRFMKVVFGHHGASVSLELHYTQPETPKIPRLNIGGYPAGY
jgi:hypothetical protein